MKHSILNYADFKALNEKKYSKNDELEKLEKEYKKLTSGSKEEQEKDKKKISDLENRILKLEKEIEKNNEALVNEAKKNKEAKKDYSKLAKSLKKCLDDYCSPGEHYHGETEKVQKELETEFPEFQKEIGIVFDAAGDMANNEYEDDEDIDIEADNEKNYKKAIKAIEKIEKKK